MGSPSEVEESLILNQRSEMFRLRFAPLNMTSTVIGVGLDFYFRFEQFDGLLDQRVVFERLRWFC